MDMNQPGRQIWQEPTSQTTPNHTSEQPNLAEMMEHHHLTTNFHVTTHSNGELSSKTQQTDWQEATARNSPAAFGQTNQEERCQQFK